MIDEVWALDNTVYRTCPLAVCLIGTSCFYLYIVLSFLLYGIMSSICVSETVSGTVSGTENLISNEGRVFEISPKIRSGYVHAGRIIPKLRNVTALIFKCWGTKATKLVSFYN